MQLFFPNFDWQNPHAYASIEDIDRAGLAWEFVRRDPAYSALVAGDLARTCNFVGGPMLIPEAEDVADPWGLSFRRA